MTAGSGETATEERLRAENLRPAYDHRIVVSDLSVSIPPGKVTVIVGPNACGKSTLLRAMARLLKPSAGNVYLDGSAIKPPPHPGGGQPPRHPAPLADRPRAFPSPTWWPGAGHARAGHPTKADQR